MACTEEFLEVFVNTPLEVCEDRDPKGLYKKARMGLISDFTGIDSPYEEPVEGHITLSTLDLTASECADLIISELQERNIL